MFDFYFPLSLSLRSWFPLLHTVWLGTIKIGYSNNGVKHHVSKIIIHPKFQDSTADIALLKLLSRVTFTPFILPICLPSITKQLTIPDTCWVTGWGNKNGGGEDGLRKVLLCHPLVPFRNIHILDTSLLRQIFFNKTRSTY